MISQFLLQEFEQEPILIWTESIIVSMVLDLSPLLNARNGMPQLPENRDAGSPVLNFGTQGGRVEVAQAR